MRIWALGPLEISDGTENRRVGAAKQRALLAALVVRAGTPVSVDSLIEEIWGGSPPDSAVNLVQGYVASVRRALGDSEGELLRTQAPGYQLVLPPDELDVRRFESHTEQGQRALTDGDSQRAAYLLAEALELWRGQPFADVTPTAAVEAEANRLEQLRMAAVEARIEADLNLGRHAELVPELHTLTRSYPLRERFWAQLMLALYRSGRQAEALDAYQRLYRLLDNELGVEPSRLVRELHQQILVNDPALDSSSLSADGGGTATPRQLPAGIGGFIGRTDQLAQLDALLLDSPVPAVVVSAITGTAGIGKTALAVHWAHRAADRFPDGQLYANLRGFDPAGVPVQPAEVVRGFLDALGVPPERIPVQLEDQAALYRSLLADTRVLVLLDNARDADQVRPLLPGSPGCLVLITSRNPLESLIAAEAARPVPIDLLSAEEANALLAARLGKDRVAAEPEAVDALIASCTRLPLALAIVAARATVNPQFTLAALATELAASRTSLEPFAGGDATTDLRAVFSWSYRQLEAEAQRLFRLLGLHPGPDVTTSAAASLAGRSITATSGLLHALCQAHLLTEHIHGRFAFHDLLRAYAAELAGRHDNDTEQRAAVRRLLDHYLHTAYGADRLIHPRRDPLALPTAEAGVAAEMLDDADQAMAWFADEHAVLLGCLNLAVTSGFDVHVWQLAWSTGTFFQRRGHRRDMAAASMAAVDATVRLGDKPAQTIAQLQLARAELNRGRLDDARVHTRQALALAGELGDSAGAAQAHLHLTWVYERLERYTDALDHAQEAVTLFRSAGHRRGEAMAHNIAGWHQAHLGQYQQALDSCTQAIAMHQDLGNHQDEAATWDSLGYAHHKLGQHETAITCYRRAITLCADIGIRDDQATILTHLADAQQDSGQHADAVDSLRQALTILEDLDHPDADDVRAKLTSLAS